MKRVYTTPNGITYDLYLDMLKQAHLLVAGKTGSGKSVVINGLIYTGLLSSPATNQFVLIDPKKVNLKKFKDLPHTIVHAITKPQIIKALEDSVRLMDNRFSYMYKHDLEDYDGSNVYVCIDELMDLMTTYGKHTRELIQYLAQVGRAAKVHVIAATQSPVREIIPTSIKCNFDSRIGLRTRSAQDSRNILGLPGCELLPEYGQGYYMTPRQMTLYNIPMIEPNEMKRIIDYWKKHKKPKLTLFAR